ncbi:hypothetical protein NQZ68_010997 [Dissostichus eleginoides]|nr:hypothetical protein NQZ68_010997 [Dissostichus eleginoides]
MGQLCNPRETEEVLKDDTEALLNVLHTLLDYRSLGAMHIIMQRTTIPPDVWWVCTCVFTENPGDEIKLGTAEVTPDCHVNRKVRVGVAGELCGGFSRRIFP